MKYYLLPLALAALLTGCGGGGGSDPAAAANAASDAFFSAVANLVGSTSETAEPIDVNSITLGTSETKEPMPVI